jgi:hypothetical protein
MDVERARAELGLDVEFTREQLRRAYLRAVRKHPPERDPDGFQRVRAANELLQLVAKHGAAPSLISEPPPPSQPEQAPSPPEPGADTKNEAAAEAKPPPQIPRLTGEDPVADARALIAGLELSSLVPPPPYLCLIVVLQLVAAGKNKLAGELWESFDRRATLEGWGAREIPPELAGRWQIVRETIELTTRVPKPMTRALARATLDGKYFAAASAVEDALLLEGAGLQQVFSKRAPVLYAAVWPAVDAGRVTGTSSPRTVDFRRPQIPWFAALLAATTLIRLCAGSLSSSSPSTTHDSPPRTTPVTLHVPSPAERPSDEGAELARLPELTEVLQRQLAGSSQVVDDAIASNDCTTLREQWPLYKAAHGATLGDQAGFVRRREEVRSHCPELDELLGREP